MSDYTKVFLITAALLCGNLCMAESTQRNDLLKKGEFIQIPGPNPILTTGPDGAWDDYLIETGGVLKDFGTYYIYYHGSRKEPWAYQTGIATSTNPLGPFKKYDKNPIMTIGPKGSWDDVHVACAMVLKEGVDQYAMWYSGMGRSEQHRGWCIGLATAESPLGPWKKHPENPVLDDFGYVGGVVKSKGKYHLYTAIPSARRAPTTAPWRWQRQTNPEVLGRHGAAIRS